MPNAQPQYIAIDLKSFFASVECVERNLNPLSTNLVVADNSRTDKTICLAVSPSLKAYGIAGRARLFEVVQKVRQINAQRRCHTYAHQLTGKSFLATELQAHPDWEVDYITATPRMKLYIEYSRKAYSAYLKYIDPKDIHIYSIDEVFINIAPYIKKYNTDAHNLARMLIREVLARTGITATVGIGTNLYLAKIAMDIVAKHQPSDKNGARIALLDEQTYRTQLWNVRPLTKFWRVGKGLATKLAQHGMFTMGDIARQSVKNEEVLYKLLGVNAELLIDHAWGWEPCTIQDIHNYHPNNQSLSRGQVLQEPYTFEKARVVMHEMADAMALTLLSKGLVTNQLVIHVNYDRESLNQPQIQQKYHGNITIDSYGRSVPHPTRGTAPLEDYTSSSIEICKTVMQAFDRVVNPQLLMRQINLVACNVIPENQIPKKEKQAIQLDLFTDYEALKKEQQAETEQVQKELRVQKTILKIKQDFGKNAILKGINFADGATMIERNSQIGGHKA